MTGHEQHDVVNLTAGRPDGPVGRRVCLDCDQVLGPLVLCGERTKAGKACRVPVRIDLGHRTCWSHGEGAGRTSTPTRWKRRTFVKPGSRKMPEAIAVAGGRPKWWED